MKLITIYESILNELMGLSLESRSWIPILGDILNTNESDIVIVNGKDYPEQYSKFPVDVFNITRKDDEIFAYDEELSGYHNGKYRVFLLISKVDNKVPLSTEKLYRLLGHELRHAYDDYNRRMNNKPSTSQTKETNLLFSGDFVKFFTEGNMYDYFPFKMIFYYLYLTSKAERTAYSDNIFDNDNKTYNTMLHLSKNEIFDRRHIHPDGLKYNWKKLKNEIHIPIFDKFDNHDDFIQWSTRSIKHNANKILKKFNKVRYLKYINNL